MSESGGNLGFPDGPRSDLDRALADVLESAQRVLATQGRLRSLLAATAAVAEELELPRVLRRITEAAMGLVGARYGAMGVIAPDGTLEQFIHVGMPPEEVARIPHLPRGRGLLGALIEDPHPIRLEHLADDPRSSGFPTGHPPMDSFLGVPIRVRGEVFGNLYLSEQRNGSFTAEDEELLTALAAAAAVAIDNARLYERTARHQSWSAASAEVSAALLGGEIQDVLRLIADKVAAIADAALVSIVLPVGDGSYHVEVAGGELADRVEDLTFDATGTLAGRAIESGQPVMDDLGGPREAPVRIDIGPALALPLRSSSGVTGAITVARAPGAPRFRQDELELAADFSDQASVALELARARADQQRLELLDDRSRIARDLHDHVIQRLFATGLSLQAAAARERDPALRDQLMSQVGTLDVAIADIRTAIFAMSVGGDRERVSLRHRVLDVVTESAPALGHTSRVEFDGPIDLVADAALGEDAAAVVREALANVARHAAATSSLVRVSTDGERFTIAVNDDGRGVPAETARSSGLSNLRARAEQRAGTLRVEPLEPRGTVLTWTVRVGEERTT